MRLFSEVDVSVVRVESKIIMKKTLLYITNIPTPYRNFRFNALSDMCLENGLELRVLYMNEKEPDRAWKINTSEMKHQFTVFSKHKVKKALGMWMHFSPKLQFHLLKTDYDIAILGGLASPAHFIASLLLKSDRLNLLSVESNVASIGNHSGLASKVKQALMKRFKYFQVTGAKAAEFVRHYVGNVPQQRFVSLPNVINEPLFLNNDIAQLKGTVAEKIANAKENKKSVVFIPARLIEEKGLSPFFDALTAEDPVSILVAGDGPLRETLTDKVSKSNLDVSFLGAKSPEETAALMKASDYLCLPSKSDPSPLSVIEALACGLPILASKSIGNFDDVVDEGKNGWGFDFGNVDSTRYALTQLFNADEKQRAMMSAYAKEKFATKFHSKKVLQQYINEIKALATL